MPTIIARASARVLSVEERFQTIRGHLDANKQTVLEQENLGWFIRITESSAIGVGPNKPDVQAGDEIIITLEKP